MTGRIEARFPFGQLSTERPPRRPSRNADLFVLGVYPSALHLAWHVPRWAVDTLELPPRVAALAVDVEPAVFWDGSDAVARVEAWKDTVAFVEGDGEG